MFFSISLTTHSWFFQFVRSLIDLGSALTTYGGMLYFGKSSFLSFMSCLYTTQFSYEGCTIYVHYYSSLFNGRIHTNIHLFIHVIQPLFFSLFFLCMLMRIISSLDLFPILLINIISHSIDLLFLHGIRYTGSTTFPSSIEQQGWSSSTELRSASSLLSLSKEELV